MKNSPSKVAYFSKMGEILSTVLPKAARSARQLKTHIAFLNISFTCYKLFCKISYAPGQDLQAGVVKIHASTQSMFLECGGFSRKQLYLEEVV
jgi:hypothetical protein